MRSSRGRGGAGESGDDAGAVVVADTRWAEAGEEVAITRMDFGLEATGVAGVGVGVAAPCPCPCS